MMLGAPWFIAVLYWVGYCVTWRTMTGHMAWSVHRTSTDRKTIRPPIENWIFSAIPCGLIALVWPAVLLFVVPWKRFARGSEKEAEVMLARVSEAEFWDNFELENARLDKLLGEPESVKGEVEDAPQKQQSTWYE